VSQYSEQDLSISGIIMDIIKLNQILKDIKSINTKDVNHVNVGFIINLNQTLNIYKIN